MERIEQKSYRIDSELAKEVAEFGAKDMEICMQCGACAASCPLSEGTHTFPRKIYRYLQLGLRDKLLAASEPWLCYYCGECNTDCPRGAEPAETMMAVRRWLTAQYDWTGLARRFYLSETWELGALGAVSAFIVLLFLFFHGPIVTDRVSVNTFAPVMWIEIGDLVMAAILSTFLLSNAFRMYRFTMKGVKAPLSVYIREAKHFVLHFLTQKRWRQCGEDRSRWVKHFILVTGYLTMMTLIIVCIRWFQVDDSSWHFTSIFGYYATFALLIVTVEMFRSRLRKEEAIHRYSELSDWLFLILLFATTLTGIIMHGVRLAGWPMGTYVAYVIHLAVAVPMLVIEVPFGKWSHLFYRPLAIYLAGVKEKLSRTALVDAQAAAAVAGEAFMTCLQCGACTSICPWNRVAAFSPRRIIRQIAMDAGTVEDVDRAVWDCVTCDACGEQCPRGIDIVDVVKGVRQLNVEAGRVPDRIEAPLISLRESRNPWEGRREARMDWMGEEKIPACGPENEFGLFACCTTAYDTAAGEAGRSLVRLLQKAGVSFGTFGGGERCCGDPAQQFGSSGTARSLINENSRLIIRSGVKKIVTTSPHCLTAFKMNYPDLNGRVSSEHYATVLAGLIDADRLTPVEAIDRVVTYHDPCYLGRRNRVWEAPRRVLQSIPGLTLVEMADSREQSMCCGGGGSGAWLEKPPGERLGVLRVEEALGTGAEVIATACPYCIRMLNEAVIELSAGDRIVVRDLAELLWESVRAADEADASDRIDTYSNQEVRHV